MSEIHAEMFAEINPQSIRLQKCSRLIIWTMAKFVTAKAIVSSEFLISLSRRRPNLRKKRIQANGRKRNFIFSVISVFSIFVFFTPTSSISICKPAVIEWDLIESKWWVICGYKLGLAIIVIRLLVFDLFSNVALNPGVRRITIHRLLQTLPRKTEARLNLN